MRECLLIMRRLHAEVDGGAVMVSGFLQRSKSGREVRRQGLVSANSMRI